MKLRYLFLISLLFHTVLTYSISRGKYPITNFSSEVYKAGIQNIYFAQNRDLNLFVANNLGVLSFNGNEWERHAYNTGKKHRSLAFDKQNNRLYVGSQGDFGYFENDWDYISLIDNIPAEARDFDEVWDIYIHNSNVYFCTFQGIYVFDGRSIFVLKDEKGFNKSFHVGNRLFTQNSSGVLFEIEGMQLTRSIKQRLTGQIVAGLIKNEEGYLIFYNSGKIEFSAPNKVSLIFSELAHMLDGKYINHVMRLSDARLVISTQTAGLFLFNTINGQIENITSKDGLQSNACLRTFQDYSGNLWVGMQNGMALIDMSSPLKLINQDIELYGSGYEAYDSAEGTYYTTSNGIYFLPKDANHSRFLDGTEGPAYGMQLINAKLYAGHHTGLFLLQNGKATRRAFTEGLWQVKQLQSNPQYAIGGTYSGLYLFRINEEEALEEVKKIEGFNESSRFFEEDRQGRIWVSQYYKGLYQLKLDNSLLKAQIVKTPDSYDLDPGKHVLLNRIDDALYLGTDQGVFKIDQTSDRIVKDAVFSGEIGENWVYLLQQDNQKNVYVFTEDKVGLFKQVSPGNYVYIPSSLFQLRQSFNNDLLKISRNVRDGIFFNANKGFIHYNPELEERVMIVREPVVSKVYNLNEDSVLYYKKPFENRPNQVDPIRILQGTKVLQFFVESFKFKDVNNQQFRYHLKGFDDGYGDWTRTNVKEYTNLKEGNYEFYVQTLNNLGEIVTGQPLNIIVDPPFYKSTPAKIIYGILAMIILSLVYLYQKQRYKGKASMIEEKKQREIDAKQHELKKLKEDQTESELRHVNNLLAASTMNLVVKNEFIENIKEEIKQVKNNGKIEDTGKALERIVKEIDTTLKIQEDWKQFEYHFDRVHGDFLNRLTNEFTDLTPGEQKLCAFLRLKMDSKEIANLMGISLRGVEVARYRLRKKLDLTSHQNLSKFILEY